MPPKRDQDELCAFDPDRNYLAQKLKEVREYLGLSQEYVSQQTKIPRPAISEVEAGRRKVESLELNRLAALYGRPLGYFLPDHKKVHAASPGLKNETTDRTQMKLRTLTRDLPPEDREEILRFAEYLRHKKQASQARHGEAHGRTP